MADSSSVMDTDTVPSSEQASERCERPSEERSGTPVSGTQGQNKKRIQEKETFQRINYLFQAAHLMTVHAPKATCVSTYYSSMIRGIAVKSQLRMYPSMKRQLCRGCEGLLLPGITARVRLKSHPVRCSLWTCFICGTVRRFPGKQEYQLWVEKSESTVKED